MAVPCKYVVFITFMGGTISMDLQETGGTGESQGTNIMFIWNQNILRTEHFYMAFQHGRHDQRGHLSFPNLYLEF